MEELPQSPGQNSEDGRLTFGESERGREVAFYQSYVFHCHRECNSHKTWRCSKYSTEIKCRSVLKASGSQLISHSDHRNHLPNPLEIPKRVFSTTVKKASLSTTESTSRLTATELSKIEPELKAHVPGLESLSRFVRLNRQVHKIHVTSPTDLNDLEIIPEKLQQLNNGQQFLQHDSGPESGANRFLVFGTTESINWLNQSSSLFIDATFDAAPKIFRQLLVIIGMKETAAFPCLFILMPNKEQQMYDTVLKEVKRLAPDLNPTFIMTDFEQASITALKTNFKDAKNKCCFFHFCQSIVRKCKTINPVWTQYLGDLKFSLEIRKLFALAFVPENEVLHYFDILMKSEFYSKAYDEDDIFPDSELDASTLALRSLVVYFETTWIRRYLRNGRVKGGLYSLSLWNCYENVMNGWARTNNLCEGFNNSFNSILCSSHPTLWKLIEDLKLKAELTHKALVDLSTGYSDHPRKRKKYTDYDTRLTEVVKTFGNSSPSNYLSSLANIIVPK